MFLNPQESSNNTNSQTSDYLGMISAIICLIHCLVGPILIAVGVSSHEGHSHDHGLDTFFSHQMFDILFLVIGLVAVIFSAAHTRERWMKYLLWISYFFLAGTLLLSSVSLLFQYLSYGAALVLITAHFIKIKQTAQGVQIKVKS